MLNNIVIVKIGKRGRPAGSTNKNGDKSEEKIRESYNEGYKFFCVGGILKNNNTIPPMESRAGKAFRSGYYQAKKDDKLTK